MFKRYSPAIACLLLTACATPGPTLPLVPSATPVPTLTLDYPWETVTLSNAPIPSVNTPIPKTLSQSPLLFSYIVEFPKDEFLFIYLEDAHEPYCLDGLCECPFPIPDSVWPPMSFQDDRLTLNQDYFHPVPDDWIDLRKNTNSISLYGVYIEIPLINSLHLYTSFPIDLEGPKGQTTIIGVNSEGDIQIKTNDGYVIILAGSDYMIEHPESINVECKVLHNFVLHNYGFIKDEGVIFESFSSKYGP